MNLVAVLVVEVGDEVTPSQWEIFRDELGKLEWDPIEPLTGVWCGAYEDDVTEDDAVGMAMDDVADAAEVAGIDAFEAVVHFGPNTPAAFSDEDYEDVGDEGEEDKE